MAIIPAQDKVFMVSNSTNTTYGGSAALQAMNQWYTMEDVSNTVKPYKVFTALLTQSGSDGAAQGISASPLTVGATYYIEDNGGSGWDFTNVGAPDNNLFTYFVATGTTPNSWGIDGQLAYTPGAPVATVLENTIGNIWFTYAHIGGYCLNSNSLFTANKTTTAFMPNQYTESPSDLYNFNGYFMDESSIKILSYLNYDVQDGLYGGFASNSIEIRVYN
jgi:hypothetical protein